MALHTSANLYIYVHARITISLVVDLEVPRANLTTTYFIVCRTKKRTVFSNTNVYETNRQAEFTSKQEL